MRLAQVKQPPSPAEKSLKLACQGVMVDSCPFSPAKRCQSTAHATRILCREGGARQTHKRAHRSADRVIRILDLFESDSGRHAMHQRTADSSCSVDGHGAGLAGASRPPASRVTYIVTSRVTGSASGLQAQDAFSNGSG